MLFAKFFNHSVNWKGIASSVSSTVVLFGLMGLTQKAESAQLYNNYKYPWDSSLNWTLTQDAKDNFKPNGEKAGSHNYKFALDFAPPKDSSSIDILAPAPGQITNLQLYPNKQVLMDLETLINGKPSGEKIRLIHLDSDSVTKTGLKVGSQVKQGQILGQLFLGPAPKVNDVIPWSTGTHLHMEFLTLKNQAVVINGDNWEDNQSYFSGDTPTQYPSKSTNSKSNLFDSQEAENQVKQLYREVLDREGDPGGVEGNVKLLASGGKLADVRFNLANSPESKSNVNKIYQEVLDREGDADGVQGFVNALEKDAKLSDVRYAIANSNEAKNKIKNIFQEILNRGPDDKELSQWTKRLSQSQPETFTLKDIRQSVETAKKYNLSPQTAFIDVPSNQTFAKDIYDLARDGVISGFGDGYFRPDWNVTRGQFAKFVSNGFGFTPNTSCGNFLDVDSSNTFYSYITTLKCEGIINGNNGYFSSDQNVTRGEAAKFIINALQKQNNDYHWTSNVSSNSAFKDVPNTYTFYKEIMGAYEAHVVDGFEPNAAYGQNTFMPDSPLSRGAASKLVNRGRSLLNSPSYHMTNAGLNQNKSLTPSVTKNGWKYFFDVPTGLWFDPPTTYGFKFEALDDSLFTSLLDFPISVAADNLFTVSVANQILGNFTPGQSVDFVSLLGHGVSEFTVTIASLLANTNTTTDVPFQLAFDRDNGSFRMQEIEQKDSEQVPEPCSILGTLLGCSFLGIRSRQKQKAIANSR